LLDGSGMSGDVHVPFCERLRVRVPWSTFLPKSFMRSKTRLRGFEKFTNIDAKH